MYNCIYLRVAGMYLSTRQIQVKICKDELVKLSARPSDENYYSQIIIIFINSGLMSF